VIPRRVEVPWFGRFVCAVEEIVVDGKVAVHRGSLLAEYEKGKYKNTQHNMTDILGRFPFIPLISVKIYTANIPLQVLESIVSYRCAAQECHRCFQ